MTLLMVALGLLALWWLLGRLEQAMTYHPGPPVGVPPTLPGGPVIENVTLHTADGETLQAWWLPQPDPAAPLLLFLHGNAGTRADRLHNLLGLWAAGFQVLIPDYRGYGGSSGRPSEAGLALDADAALAWLREHNDGNQGVIVFGRSLGGAVAAGLAARAPVRGLIIESTFTSATEMAARMLPIPGIGRVLRARYDTLAALRTYRGPLRIIHGTADSLIPHSMGERLFAAAASTNKRMHSVPGGDHNDTYITAGAAYYPWLLEILENTQ